MKKMKIELIFIVLIASILGTMCSRAEAASLQCDRAEQEIMASMLTDGFFRLEGVNIEGMHYTMNAVEFYRDPRSLAFFGTVSEKNKWHAEQLLKVHGVKFTPCTITDMRKSFKDPNFITEELGWVFYTREVVLSQGK